MTKDSKGDLSQVYVDLGGKDQKLAYSPVSKGRRFRNSRSCAITEIQGSKTPSGDLLANAFKEVNKLGDNTTGKAL